MGGPLALVQEGDEITIDAETRQIRLDVAKSELERRLRLWTAPAPSTTRGVLAKYVRSVSSASLGAITDGVPSLIGVRAASS